MSGEIMLNNNGSSAGISFCNTFADVVADDRRKTREWTDMLWKKGVKAAHPDDGWVKRDVDEIHITYPYFGRNPNVNDVIALGDWRKYRLVRIVSVYDLFIGGYRVHKFTDRLSTPYDVTVDNLEEYVEGMWFGC